MLKVGPTRMFSVLGAKNSRRVFSAMASQYSVGPFFVWLFLMIRIKVQSILHLPYNEIFKHRQNTDKSAKAKGYGLPISFIFIFNYYYMIF